MLNKHSSNTKPSNGLTSDAITYANDVEPLLSEGGGMLTKVRKFLLGTPLGRATTAVLGIGVIGGVVSGCAISKTQANTVTVNSQSFWNGDMGANLQTGTSWDHQTVHLTIGNDCRVSTHTGNGKSTSYSNIDTVEYKKGQRVGVLRQDPGGFWGHSTSELKEGTYTLGAERTHTSWGQSKFHTVSGVEVKVVPVTQDQYRVTMFPHGDTKDAPVSKTCTPDFGIGY
jgi:hypothetical protein